MKPIYKIYIPLVVFITVIGGACKKQLDVQNPNQPGPEAAKTESGLLSYAQGLTYLNGFDYAKYGDGVLGSTFYTGVLAIHEMMGDVVGMEAANVYGNQIGCPDWVKLDDGSTVNNPNAPNKQIVFLKQVNLNANQGQNPLYFEWAFMYNVIFAENTILNYTDQVTFTGNADTKKKALQAWCYWWKGFAYARIGSFYYAGIVNDSKGAEDPTTSGRYLSHDSIINESNKNLDMAASLLSGLSDDADYEAVIGKLIPDIFQVGKGGVLTPAMWKRNINTLKARNMLVNTKAGEMTAAQWNSIIALTQDGVQANDNVFTARSNANGDFMSASSGNLVAKTISSAAGGGTYKVSERLIQDYYPGDKRFENNYLATTPWFGNSDRGNTFNTRYALVDGGKGLTGVAVIGTISTGDYELYMAVTYEENQLMLAEAKINTGSIKDGLTIIDQLRDGQGAGLAHIANTVTTPVDAKEVLRRERRVELAYRGLSFYDARRWGIIYDVTAGGGKKNAVVLDNAGNLNKNAVINYNFLDYWDVPDNELVYNPPAEGSAPVKNPQ